MSDELNVWAAAVSANTETDDEPYGASADAAAAVIRDYGDRRDATARSEGHTVGYQKAIADVVEWLLIVGKEADEILPNGGELARRFSREATRRFGKDA